MYQRQDRGTGEIQSSQLHTIGTMVSERSVE